MNHSVTTRQAPELNAVLTQVQADRKQSNRHAGPFSLSGAIARKRVGMHARRGDGRWGDRAACRRHQTRKATGTGRDARDASRADGCRSGTTRASTGLRRAVGGPGRGLRTRQRRSCLDGPRSESKRNSHAAVGRTEWSGADNTRFVAVVAMAGNQKADCNDNAGYRPRHPGHAVRGEEVQAR